MAINLKKVAGQFRISADQEVLEVEEAPKPARKPAPKAAVQPASRPKVPMKVKEALGVTGEMDVIDVAKQAAAAVSEQAKAKHEELVIGVLKEKVSGEMAQALVRKMVQVPADATKEQVAGEVDRVLADEAVKSTLSKLHVDQPAPKGNGAGDPADGGLRTRRVQI
jgi:hypothetical protein